MEHEQSVSLSFYSNNLIEVFLKRNMKLKTQYNLAQQNPPAFFQELKYRLDTYQNKTRLIDDDPMAILDHQIAKTIDEADTDLFELSNPPFPRYDSGVGTDSSEKFVPSSLITHSHFSFLEIAKI